MFNREPPLPPKPSGQTIDELRVELMALWDYLYLLSEDYKRVRWEHRDLVEDGASKIRDITVETASPSNGQYLAYNSTTEELEWTTP
jgi:hypothetical protein